MSMRAALPYWRLSGFYFFYFALLGATAPYWALYLAELGFSAARIGELLAIPMLMRCLAPNLWGYWLIAVVSGCLSCAWGRWPRCSVWR